MGLNMNIAVFLIATRKHSSRTRTTRLPTVYGGGGVSIHPGRVPSTGREGSSIQRGGIPSRVSVQRWGIHPEGGSTGSSIWKLPSVSRQTSVKHYLSPTASFGGGNYEVDVWSLFASYILSKYCLKLISRVDCIQSLLSVFQK